MKLVRLVRACGSKPFLAVGFEVEGTKVRLVRACGSKQYHKRSLGTDLEGQARKSLWIETLKGIERTGVQWVRLVRACGSKLLSKYRGRSRRAGQARKSLWIETMKI